MACILVPYRFPENEACSINLFCLIISSNVGRSVKWYALPGSSPALGLRVVCETLKLNLSGYSAKRRLRSVDFPAPEGPDKTKGIALLITLISNNQFAVRAIASMCGSRGV